MSDNEDDFVTYGNALEPLDEENLPRKKAITIEEQFAYDAQGRRRFHGAFTGGFSAGYFNTVGTRDGWRPQQFKSTRSSKADNLVQRPEDFMDEEDTGQFGIAPTAIRAAQGYSEQSGKGTKRDRAKQDSSGPIPGNPVLKELLKPVRERVGVTLLKKMGWKPGQGVGPRLTKKEKKQQNKQREKVKIYGCSLPTQEERKSASESESSDDEYANITFAPDDYEPYRCNPKDNYFGIGYSGLDRRPILGQHINLFDGPTFSVQDKNKKLSIRGQAFGVGAFEAEDDDIYAKEDMSCYDFALGPERKSKSRWAKEEKAKPDCIEGFVPSKQQLSQKKVFPAPVLPKDFQPVHKIRTSRFSTLAGDKHALKRPEMNAQSRAKIINDDRPSIIDSKSTSVANQIISRSLNLFGKDQVAERQRLEQEKPKKTSMSWLDKLSSTTFVRGETMGIDPKIKGNLQDASTFSQETEKAEMNLVKPSFADLDKQRRFEQYLIYSENDRKLKFPSHQPLSMTDWERDQEILEFEKAAKICLKVDSSLQEQPKEKEKIDLDTLNPEDRMTAAAKMKMFGQLTRIVSEWKPAKLVCVRFNIAEPFVGVAEEDRKKKKFSIFDSVAWDEMSRFQKGANLEYETEPRPSTSSSSSSYQCVPFTNEKSEDGFRVSQPMEEPAEIIEEVETLEKPTANMNIQEKKDLFKSIFLSSSEESESENEDDEEKVKAVVLGKSAEEQNVQRNTSPPRGIFAKLDLDSLMKRPDKSETKKGKETEEEEKEEEKSPIVEDVPPPDIYGPVLPEAIPPTEHKPIFLSLSRKVIESEEGIWVEKRDKKKSKKEKKKHKHKERSRSKSRKKSKKEKKH